MGIWQGMVSKINVALIGHWFTLQLQYSSGTFYFLLGFKLFLSHYKIVSSPCRYLYDLQCVIS